MPFIKWDARFETGIGAVDAEHQEIIKLINRLHNELEGVDRVVLMGCGKYHVKPRVIVVP